MRALTVSLPSIDFSSTEKNNSYPEVSILAAGFFLEIQIALSTWWVHLRNYPIVFSARSEHKASPLGLLPRITG